MKLSLFRAGASSIVLLTHAQKAAVGRDRLRGCGAEANGLTVQTTEGTEHTGISTPGSSTFQPGTAPGKEQDLCTC